MRTCHHCSVTVEYGVVVRGNLITTIIFCSPACLSKVLSLSDLVKLYK